MSTAPKVYAAIQAVMKAVGVIGKDRTNPQQGYKFRGIDDVMAELQGHMVTHGLVVVPRVTHAERETVATKSGGSMYSVRLTVEFTLFSVEDGSSVVVTTIGEAMDSGDKASNKAMSAAFKYFATLTFVIPTKESAKDTEEATPELAAPMPQTGRASTVPATKGAPKAPARSTVAKASGGPTNFPNYGKNKGGAIRGSSEDDLAFYAKGAERSIADPSKARFHAQESALLAAIREEQARQYEARGELNGPPPPSDDDRPF